MASSGITWGDSSDGDIHITNGNTMTLTKDLYANSIRIDVGGILCTNGWRIFVSDAQYGPYGGQFLNNGLVHNNGNNAVGNTGGAATGSGTLSAGAAGANAPSTAGDGNNGTNCASCDSTNAGNGGNSNSYLGGTGGIATPPSAAIGGPLCVRVTPNVYTSRLLDGSVLGAAPSGGSGSLETNGYTSGAGGGGAGNIIIISKRLDPNGISNGTISVNGGNGSDAQSGSNSGGGAGGSGGTLTIISIDDPIISQSYIYQVNGGTGGNGDGTGTAGQPGGNGTFFSCYSNVNP